MHLPHYRLLFLCAATLALPAHLYAEDSTLLARSANGETLYYAVLDGVGGIKTVHTRLVYSSPQTVGDIHNVLASVSVEQFDCMRMTRTATHIELYDNADAKGLPIWTKDLTAADKAPQPIDLGASTASTIVYKKVCLFATSDVLVASPDATLTAKAASSPVSAALPPPPPLVKEAAALPGLPAVTVPSVSAGPTHTGDAAPSVSPPRATRPIADFHPYASSALTLGMMGRLAEYVYFDDAELAFLDASLHKVKSGRDRIALDGKAHPLVDEAHRRIERRTRLYRDKVEAKKGFLVSAQLKVLELPRVSRSAIASFRAELYQYLPTGEKVLVFRGSKEPLDWVSNVWSSVDLWSIEAPHYQAAYELVSTLRKRGDKPLVIGHSLGGGMAQYVGYKFGLKVVAFNSAPLPERYFRDGQGTNVDLVRLVSAVEVPPQPNGPGNQGYADPASIDLPNDVGLLKQLFGEFEPVKAHYHLTKPICVKSVPEPFITGTERENYSGIINGVLSKGLASAVIGGVVEGAAADAVIVRSIRQAVKDGLSDPVWMSDSKDAPDIRVAEAVKKEVTQIAVDQYKAIGGATSVLKGGYKLALGNTWGDVFSGAAAIAYVGGKVAAADYAIAHWLNPHSMERLNRGMQIAVDDEVFLADPVRAQCQTVAIAFP